jgi:hypothetical protein
MSVSEKLRAVSSEPRTRICKLGGMLNGSLLSEEDKAQIKSVLDTPYDDPSRISNNRLSQILREEGYDVSSSAVDRHKKKSCGCYNRAVGK